MSSKRRKQEVSDDEEETKQEHSEAEEEEEPSRTKRGEHKTRRSPNFNFPKPPLKRRMSDPGPKASLARIFGPSAEVLYGHKLPVALGIESAHTEEKKHGKAHEEEHPEAPHDTTGKIKYYGGIAFDNFMGDAPIWYKRLILFFLVLNLFVRIGGPYVCGWIIIAEFFVTMCLSHLCYPLQTGGLIVFEGIVMKLVDTHNIYHVVEHNLPVLLLLMFLAAGIYFLRQLLLYIFTQVIVNLEDKKTLSLVFMLTAATLSAWLNAITVVGVLVSVCTGFYAVYHRVATEETLISKGLPLPKKDHEDDHGHGGHGHGHDPVDTHDSSDDSQLSAKHNKTLEEFRAFLRSLLIHGVIGTAVGGVFTPVGEPQNLIISTKLDYRFTEYIVRNSPVAVFNAFSAVCVLIALEFTPIGKQFGHGAPLPKSVRKILEKAVIDEHRKQTYEGKLRLYIQAVMLLIFIILLLTDGAAIGLIGLTLLVMVTIFTGICDEHSLGQSFVESLPLCALVVVFLTINAMVEENHLFADMMDSVIHHSEKNSYASLFFLNGFLSCISDNIFCGTQFISEMVHQRDFDHISKSDLNLYGVVINAATNIPSIATPNGQPGFLFLYLSALAKFVRLDYRTIVWMTAPYTLVLTLVSLAVSVNIRSFTESIVSLGSLEMV